MMGKKPRSGSGSDTSYDVVRLILRGAIGGTMIAHGVKHGRTLDGTAGWFESIGFDQPELQARLSAVVEVGSGASLIAGAATPAATAAVVGTMAVAIRTVHAPNGFFITREGWEYTGVLSAAAVALAGLGSGRLSLDRAVGLDDIGTPMRRALFAAGVGIAGAAVQLSIFWRTPTDG